MGAASSTQPKLSPQLLDTKLLHWLAIAPERLPATLRGDLRDRRFPMLCSGVSLWEVAIKTSLGKTGFVVDAAQLRDGLKQQGLQELGIEPEPYLAVQHLPWIHQDLTLLTTDRSLRGYGHQVIWMGDGGSGG